MTEIEVNLALLKRKRAVLKSKSTNLSKFLESVSDISIAEEIFIDLENRKIVFQENLEKFNQIQNEIENLVKDEQFEDELKEREQFETTYYSLLSKCTTILNKNIRLNNNLLNTMPNVNTSRASESINNNVKLPTLQLKQFGGKAEEFASFLESFKSLIINNESIDNTSKFAYLRSSLAEEPLKVIESLEVTGDNFLTAIDLLTKRYYNKQLITHTHVKGIVEFPKIPKENFVLLRQMLDSIQSHYRSLKNLQIPVDHWDVILTYIIPEKLPYQSKKEWEMELTQNGDDVSPTYEQLLMFLEKRCKLLEKMHKQELDKPKTENRFVNKHKPFNQTQSHLANNNITCIFCKFNHHFFSCRKFLAMSVEQRISEVKRLKLCSNCFRANHTLNNCTAGCCKKCSEKHHTLLHKEDVNVQNNELHLPENTVITNLTIHKCSQQILPTAKIIVSFKNQSAICTALLDSGSMKSYMTHALATKLNLNITQSNYNVSGINQSKSRVTNECQANIKSINGKFSANMQFLLLNKITETLPEIVNHKSIQIPNNINLANPNFHESCHIDILLGVDIFWKLIKSEQPFLNDYPYLINSELGYLISGNFFDNNLDNTICNLSTATLSKQIARFWEQENCEEKLTFLSAEEQFCENHFIKTTKRLDDGKFIVNFPLNNSPEILGDSREKAKKQFLMLERKLNNDTHLKEMYSNFMAEYENLNHMQKINVNDSNKSQATYYMPHLPVIREHSVTTKLRVVFNSSSKTTSGLSLNDIQMNGPVIQPDLFTIVLRFRRFKYILSADCSKMYRCILLDQSQRPLQRILWRYDSSKPIDTYELSTVTYGQKSSSFLAIRCLFELANICQQDHPKISDIVKKDMYCDDLLVSIDSVQEAEYVCQTISQLFESAGFILRKWVSNNPKIIKQLNTDDIDNKIINLNPDETTQTLGLCYSPNEDTLRFKIDNSLAKINPTKREVLSIISKIFDPLGLLSIFTISVKIFMQQLWLAKLQWDDVLSPELNEIWLTLCTRLTRLNDFRIPRHVMCQTPTHIEIHGFADASLKAYGACAYIKTISANNMSINLLCSKTKVAPLKQLTIPRLELSAAVLLVRLVEKIKNSLDLPLNHIYYWTDSKIVLAWIKTEPYRLETFVANRVSQIQSLSSISAWNYVPSKENPSDLLTRGVDSSKIKDLQIWWYGPPFLQSDQTQWPAQESLICESEIPEIKNNSPCYATQVSDLRYLFENCSTIAKTERVAAYCLRFINNCRTCKELRKKGLLTVSEREAGLNLAIRLCQKQSFQNELKLLSQNLPLPRNSKLSYLNPFYDKSLNIIRVGGRLENSNFEFNKKHPIVIPKKHHFSKILFRSEHLRLLHAGPQLLLSSIRDKYWPIGGRLLARQTTRTCIPCFKIKPKPISNIMGNLPTNRVSIQAPFTNVGVDYAGPFLIKNKAGRGAKITKCYVCVFICFATKAAHLELVSDLTTEAFILSLRRFASRRGMPSQIFSDNGKNFIGANNRLHELGKFLKNNSDLTRSLVNERFNWNFLPPYSPHMGGIWEACVKSMKTHLYRVMNNQSFTFEQLNSILCQIEAILNSRPLSPMSSDPSDLNPITPSHFLMGKSLITVPDPDVTTLNTKRLNTYQHIQQIIQHVWQRWSKEYVAELQKRYKWKDPNYMNLQGALVLLVDSNLPPARWCLGRVEEIYPGKDNMVRVVSVKTIKGLTRRAITQICPLPFE